MILFHACRSTPIALMHFVERSNAEDATALSMHPARLLIQSVQFHQTAHEAYDLVFAQIKPRVVDFLREDVVEHHP